MMTTPAPPALGQEIFSRGFRFRPTPQEAVVYYLPRLISGEPLHEVVRSVIHHADDVYDCKPADLARRFRPMPRTGDRFFFTVVNKGVRAAAGPGSSSWAAQTTTGIKDDEGVQIGELRKLRYKKDGVLMDWLMDEYSSCGAGGDDKQQQQFVFCKVYVSPRAAPTSLAHQESAAFFALPPLPPAAVIAQPAVKRTVPPAMQAAMPPCAKRTAPPPLQDAMPPCAKRMRGPVLQPAPQPPAPPARIRSPFTAVQKFYSAPPQPCAPLRGSPAPKPPTPPAPIRSPLTAVQQKLYSAPPQRCAPLRGSPAPQPPVPPAPIRSPLTAVQQKLYFAPPQPCAPLRGSPAPKPQAPPAPIRSPLTAAQKLYFGPAQPRATAATQTAGAVADSTGGTRLPHASASTGTCSLPAAAGVRPVEAEEDT